MSDDLQDDAAMLGEEKRAQEAEGLQSYQLSPSQPVLQASTYMSGMEEKDRNHLSTLVDTAIIKVTTAVQEAPSMSQAIQYQDWLVSQQGEHTSVKHISLHCNVVAQ